MELITNGGFESGTLSPGWSAGPPFEGTVTDEMHRNGRYCLKMQSLDAVQQTFWCAFATGSLRFWARTEGLAGGFLVRIEYDDDSEFRTAVSTFVETRSWREIVVPVDHSKYLRKIQFLTSETVPIYIDDVSLDGVCFPRLPLSARQALSRIDRLPLNSHTQLLLDIWHAQEMGSSGSAMEARLQNIETQLSRLEELLTKHLGLLKKPDAGAALVLSKRRPVAKPHLIKPRKRP